MPVQVARHVEFWLQKYAPESEIKLLPLALTKEQVMTYQLPRIPIKVDDVRRPNFEKRHGEGAVELDALEALFPGTLGEILRTAASPYYDHTLSKRRYAAHREAREILDAAWERATEPYRQELDAIESETLDIIAQYRNRLIALNNELQTELAPLVTRLSVVRHAAQHTAAFLEVELPACPAPNVHLPDECGWLFDSTRDYLTQLAAYQSHKRGAA